MPGHLKYSHINTGRFGALDLRVWVTMISLVLSSAGLVGYKVLAGKQCRNVVIQTRTINGKDGQLYCGETIRFTAAGSDEKITWNFGDGTTSGLGMSVVSHTYSQPGRFNVVADLNGGCRESVAITIRKRDVISEALAEYPNIEGAITSDPSATAGKAAVFISTQTASFYEWTVLNRNEFYTQSGKIASFTFPLPGTYTIQLKLNKNRQQTFFKTIYVLAGTPKRLPALKPAQRKLAFEPSSPAKADVQQSSAVTSAPDSMAKPETNTVKHQFVEVPDGYLKRSLENVVDGSKTVEDFADLLCNGSQTHVLVNNATDFITFDELCKRIRHKKYRIESVKAARDDQRNRCVLVLNVAIRRKGLFGRWKQ